MQDVQIWQHKTSGERYVVEIEAGLVIKAAGPLWHSEIKEVLYQGFNDDPEVSYALNGNPDDYIEVEVE